MPPSFTSTVSRKTDGSNRAHSQGAGEVPQGWMLSQIPGGAHGLDQLVCGGTHRVVAQVTVYARALGLAVAQKTCDTHEPICPSRMSRAALSSILGKGPMRRSCRRPSLVGGKRCRRRFEPRALSHLNHHSSFISTQSYPTTDTTTIFCWPGFCRDLIGRPQSESPPAVRRVSCGLGRFGELPGIAVVVLKTERVSSEPPLRRLASTDFWVRGLGKYTTICTTTFPGL